MYLLTKRLGEDGVNRALRNMLARYRWKGAPYPRTKRPAFAGVDLYNYYIDRDSADKVQAVASPGAAK